MTTTPTLEQLKRGIAIFQQIESLHQELADVLGNHSAPVAKAASAPAAQSDGRKGKRSAATISKMKASQQARWAKVKAPAAEKTPAPVKKKGEMSAEGRARIVAAQKARWAKIKGETAPAASKPAAKAKAEAPAKQKRKPMSPATKVKMAAAMKARWAAAKAGKGPAPTASKK